MRAEDIMSSPVITVREDMPVKTAAALLAEHGFTGAPVVDAEGRLAGIVTEADLARHRIIPDPRARLWREADAAHGQSTTRTVGEIMTSPAIACAPDTDVADLAERMLRAGIRAVPVADGLRVIGIVTRRDLLRVLARDDHAIEIEVRTVLADYGGRPFSEVSVRDGQVIIRDEFADDADRRAAVVLARTVPGVQSVRVAATIEQS